VADGVILADLRPGGTAANRGSPISARQTGALLPFGGAFCPKNRLPRGKSPDADRKGFRPDRGIFRSSPGLGACRITLSPKPRLHDKSNFESLPAEPGDFLAGVNARIKSTAVRRLLKNDF
jgi:hypothetical protein